MNTLKTSLTVLTICFLAGCSGADADRTDAGNSEWFLLIANGTPQESLDAAGRQFQDLLGNRAVPGDVIHLIATPTHTPIASLTVPEGSHNTRLRHKSIRSALPAIKSLFETQPASAGGQVQLPMVASTVGSLRRTAFPCRVILVGTPIYDDPRQQGWSMTDGLVPTDGALKAPHSPFNNGVSFPEGTTVSWLAPAGEWGADPAHRDAVTRFNRLFLQERKGTLARVTADAATAFSFDEPQFGEAVACRDEAPGMKQVTVRSVRPRQAQPEATVTVPVQPPVVATPVQPRTSTDAVQPKASAERLLNDAQADRRYIAIAINWESEDPNCDLDLWLSTVGSSEELCFTKKKTSFGELFRDVTTSGSLSADSAIAKNWEWAKVNHDRLGDVTLWINAFATQKPATVRIIRVWNGQRKEQTIRLPITTGDRAANRHRRGQSPAWIKIDLKG